MKRQSGCEEEGWSGDQQSVRVEERRCGDERRSEDCGSWRWRREDGTKVSDDEVSNHRKPQTDQIQSRPSSFLPKLRASYQNTVVLVLCFCREMLT